MDLQEQIRQILSSMKLDFFDVINESHKHNVPKDAQTHFKVIAVGKCFENLNLIARHRLINEALKDQLKSGVHALALTTKTPSEWEKNPQSIQSPECPSK